MGDGALQGGDHGAPRAALAAGREWWQMAIARASAASSGRGTSGKSSRCPHHLLDLALVGGAIAGDSQLQPGGEYSPTGRPASARASNSTPRA